MPRTVQSNGIKPYLRALAVIKLGVPVSPQEINDHVGTGDYAAKYISFLRTRNGFEFTIQKDGRKVVSYTMIKEPANAAELRSLQPKATKAKTVKAPKVAKVINPTATAIANVPKKSDVDVKAKNLETMKKVAASMKAKTSKKAKKVREFDDVTEQFGTSGEVATSYSIDKDWDSVDNLDLSKLI